MTQEISIGDLGSRKQGLLKDQVRLVKRKDCDRYEIARIQDNLSFEKGFFVVIRACQLLAQKNEGIILVGLAGPSGAGKSSFTDKILNFMPSVAVISMDNYNDGSRVIDDNFDDPRLTDYDTLLKNIYDLKEGKSVEIPIYDFKSSTRTGYRTLEVPSSHIVIIEGIYALSEKLRPLLDLRVSVTGGVHFDLVKRVLRDIQRVGQEPEEIIYQISETVCPCSFLSRFYTGTIYYKKMVCLGKLGNGSKRILSYVGWVDQVGSRVKMGNCLYGWVDPEPILS
nr:uridine-cytidine kinase C-like [Tanacetum cinerariifolium]GEZ56048.1 uridine-cytidine kinase C-like [Tanacetum cinerariifolium]